MQDVVRKIGLAVATGGGVLVVGPPGSGRRLVARTIHDASAGDVKGSIEQFLRDAMLPSRSTQPFVAVDCARGAAVEAELFGGEGASPDDPLDCVSPASAIRRACGGTLVLEHLSELPTRLQLRLARILRDREVTVHSADEAPRIARVTIRPIATNESGATGEIIPDLYKRVADTCIQVPRLQDRREDIPALVRYLLAALAADAGAPAKGASNQAVELLSALPWPGNITELRTLLRMLAERTPRHLICLSDVLTHVRLDGAATHLYGGTLREARERFEQDYVQMVLKQHRGRMSDAARALGLQRSNLYRKIRQLSVSRERHGRAAS